jgi:hypothetical protein
MLLYKFILITIYLKHLKKDEFIYLNFFAIKKHTYDSVFETL